MRSRAALLALLFVALGARSGAAQDGMLDPAFGSSGTRRIAFDLPGSTLSDLPNAVAVQTGGGIVVVGGAQNGAWGVDGAVARLTPSGAIDAGFATNGRLWFGFSVDDPLTDVLVEPDDQIVVAGSRPSGWGPDPEVFVQRLTATGGWSSGYYYPTTVEPASPAVRIARDRSTGRILVGYTSTASGYTSVRVFRLNPDLSRDWGFGFLGALQIDRPTGGVLLLTDLEVVEDGSILVVGSAWGGFGFDLFAARGDATGWLDPTFGVGGYREIAVDLDLYADDFATALAVDAAGRILIASRSQGPGFVDFAAALVRLTASGAPDPAFNGGQPLVVADTAGDDSMGGLAVQSDGRIVVAGKVQGAASPMFFAARYWPDGSADWSFGSFGVFSANFPNSPNDDYAVALALQAGRPILVGPAEWSAPDYDFGVMRLGSALLFADDFERGTTGGWSAHTN